MKLTIKTILILLFSTNILHAEYINSDKQVKIQKELDSLKINNTIQKSITTEIEKQNKFFEEKFQLQKENLEYKNSRLDNWLNFIAIILTFFGIIIPVITFSFFTKARSEINKVKEDAGNNIQNFITEIKEKFNFYEKKASQTVENIETINEKITLFHEESTKPKSMVKEPTKSNTVDLEKEIINNRFEEVINDIDLNDLEKELTNALSLYLSDKYLEAKKLYENIIKNHFQELSTETLSLVYFNWLI